MVSQRKDLILVVEDDLYVSDMLCAYLSAKRYRLATTPFGDRVLPLCQTEHPSLVLLDIKLPDIDGYEVCRRLRSNLATSTLPILFLTQRQLREDRLNGLRVEANDYITKPFDMEELHLRVRNAIREAKHRAGIGQTSGLPEGPLVTAQLKALLYKRNWAILSIRVENFHRFASSYGHLEGKFVRYVGQLIRRAADRAGSFEDFVGRVGPLHFVVLTTPPLLARLREQIEKTFDRAMNPAPEKGDTKPVTAYLKLSFGTVTEHGGPFGDVRSLSLAISHSHAERTIPACWS
jgi:DNA-binding response OmpR family regulator